MAQGIGVKNHMAENFWAYSKSLYSNPSVAKLCLDQQDHHGLDVNLLLFCLFAGEELGVCLTASLLARLDGALRPWRMMVLVPIRTTRRAVRGIWGDRSIYRMIKRIELVGERSAQLRLIACFQGVPVPRARPCPQIAADNVRLYAGESVSRAFACARPPAGC